MAVCYWDFSRAVIVIVKYLILLSTKIRTYTYGTKDINITEGVLK